MKKYSVKKTFKEITLKSFASEATSIDFAKSEEASGIVNGWVEDNTNKKIKDLIKPSDLDASTRMVLINAIYFKGSWTHPFKAHDTFEAPFYFDGTNSVSVDFMRSKKFFKYGELEDLDAKALELSYKNSDVSMLFILPNSRTGLAEMEEKLSKNDLSKISDGIFEDEVNIEIPKFKIEFETTLNDPLIKVCIRHVFSANEV